MSKINIEVIGGSIKGSLVIDVGALSTSWTAVHPRAFGAEGGQVASWGTSTAYLHGSGVTPILSLNGVTGSTGLGQTGSGEMQNPDAAIPTGKILWRCY